MSSTSPSLVFRSPTQEADTLLGQSQDASMGDADQDGYDDRALQELDDAQEVARLPAKSRQPDTRQFACDAAGRRDDYCGGGCDSRKRREPNHQDGHRRPAGARAFLFLLILCPTAANPGILLLFAARGRRWG